MDAIHMISLTMGAAWASGINLYATVFVLGYMGATGAITLPPELAYLSHPLVLGAAGLMYCVEFFTDKIPGVDTAWDSVHTFIRIPAGAVLAAQAVGELGPAVELAALLVGGGLAATSHATKAGSRVLINTSPEPASNWAASIGEDVLAIGGIWLALNHPVLFLILLLAFIALVIWLLPRIWRGFKRVFGFLARLLGWRTQPEPGSDRESGSGPGTGAGPPP